MDSISSPEFDYGAVQYIIECDSSYNGETASAGWSVIEQSTQKIVMEGSTLINFNSTDRSEIQSAIIGLRDLRNLTPDINCIILRTDYQGIVDKLQKDEHTDQMKTLVEELNEFDSWMVECVDRGEISRAHDLANYTINERD